jgi:hypothetical protein
MLSNQEVEVFLKEFKVKMSVFNILFRDERMKNTQALLRMELTPDARKKIIESIEVPDYCEGPLDDSLYGIASLWVFGKTVKKREVYIKISLGRPNNRVICISFHDSEKPMTYPFKSKPK